jgi:acid phosphatase
MGNMAAQYINGLANEGALFTNSFAITHPSQANYIALFSGSTYGVVDDRCQIVVSGDNLASELQKKGLTFGIYSESMPTTGYEGCASLDFRYARKHNPVVNWQGKNVSAEVNMPFDKFPSDYTQLPTVSMVVPNQLNDMHDGATLLDQIVQGDRWLKNNLEAYVRWAKTNNSLLIVTWDEDDGSSYNQVTTIFVGSMVKIGKYKNRIDHYNVLRTIIDMYELTPLGSSADAKPIIEIWNRTRKGVVNLNSKKEFPK